MVGGTRIGDAERDRVVDRLSELYVDGVLTEDELDQRTGEALRARTTDQLESLLEDCAPVRRRAPRGRAPRLRYVVAAVAAAALLVPTGVVTGAIGPSDQPPPPPCGAAASDEAPSCLVPADD